MMENSRRNKEIFFAQYLYQDVLFNGVEVVTLNKSWNWACESFNLVLKPLSSITDEDAIEVGNHISKCFNLSNSIKTEDTIHTFIDGDDFLKLYDYGYKKILYCRNGKRIETNNYSLKTTDYLRSKGYALPWMGLSVEQLISYNWIKLKTE